MSTGPAAGTTFFRLTPVLTARHVRDADEFGVDTQLTLEKSSNQDVAEDRVDPRLRAFWKHADPLNTTEVALVYDVSAVRDLGLTQQVPVGSDGSRTLLGLAASWSRDLDPRTTMLAEFAQDFENFTDAQTADFSRTSAALRFTRALSERQSWYAVLNGQAYRSEASTGAVPDPTAGLRSTVVGALFGVDHAFSPEFRVDASAGPARYIEPVNRNGWQANFKAEYTAERWFAGLELLRAPVVNAQFGGLVMSDTMRVRVRYDLGPQQRLELEAGHVRETASRSKRSLATVAWVRQWNESWQVSLKASTQRQEGPEGTALSNRIGVVFLYTAPDL
ncbi:hypothetical protein WG902_09825 [Ramlibacter sp. PS3R-8]|uniref:hypothetical protein n=1 Tax=Ramlibacter sp. PS3R-8 TaxID=3133437 RepID=UPI003099E082